MPSLNSLFIRSKRYRFNGLAFNHFNAPFALADSNERILFSCYSHLFLVFFNWTSIPFSFFISCKIFFALVRIWVEKKIIVLSVPLVLEMIAGQNISTSLIILDLVLNFAYYSLVSQLLAGAVKLVGVCYASWTIFTSENVLKSCLKKPLALISCWALSSVGVLQCAKFLHLRVWRPALLPHGKLLMATWPKVNWFKVSNVCLATVWAM